MVINIYALNMEAPKHIKQIITNIKEVINSIGDFNTPLTSMDKSFKQKISKEAVAYWARWI